MAKPQPLTESRLSVPLSRSAQAKSDTMSMIRRVAPRFTTALMSSPHGTLPSPFEIDGQAGQKILLQRAPRRMSFRHPSAATAGKQAAQA
ncbi:hypothetical protein [Chromobacterium violaceum]|uniref:hypothetical protein n=1 Tax=Chromobacterium violaceum TaxID=536 RepID=UPI001CE123DA|nr:hypothetical protein [Chromobacterium violaceum]